MITIFFSGPRLFVAYLLFVATDIQFHTSQSFGVFHISSTTDHYDAQKGLASRLKNQQNSSKIDTF